MDLEGTTALVTGASLGFGRAITTALRQAGAAVVAVARDPDGLSRLWADVGGAITVVAADDACAQRRRGAADAPAAAPDVGVV